MIDDPTRNVQIKPALSTTAARDSITGHNVHYFLAFGLIGVMGAFVIISMVFFGHSL
jgi:hypothetical protein